MTKTFSKEYLVNELDLPWTAIEDEIVDNGRWSIYHEIVFKDTDEKFYQTHYSIGATECQDERPWEYDEQIICTEVEKRDVTVTKWMPID